MMFEHISFEYVSFETKKREEKKSCLFQRKKNDSVDAHFLSRIKKLKVGHLYNNAGYKANK